jgi:hypothetical protein
MAQKLLINALLIALVNKGALSKGDVTVLIEASIASLPTRPRRRRTLIGYIHPKD